jgi:hypothetical protein
LYIVSLEGHLEFIISLTMHDMFIYFQWSIFPHKTQCILLHTHTQTHHAHTGYNMWLADFIITLWQCKVSQS